MGDPQMSESRFLDKVIVRLPEGMRDRIKEVAAENGRSMNAEIVFRLEQSFLAPAPQIGLGFASLTGDEVALEVVVEAAKHLLDLVALTAKSGDRP